MPQVKRERGNVTTNYATARLEPRERVKLFVLKECLDPKQDWIK